MGPPLGAIVPGMARSAPGIADSFTYAEGLAAGLTAHELRRERWQAPFRGVRCFEGPETTVELARVYAAKMRPGQFFSHATAASLHDMWLPAVVEDRAVVDVAVLPGSRQPRGVGVRGHLLIERPGLVTIREGLPVARREEVWCQLATLLGLEDLIAAGESLLAKGRRDRLPLEALVRAVEVGDRPRQRMLERALPELREGVRSRKETELRRFLVASGLPEPAINHEVFDALGDWLAEVDLAYPELRVAIEYEGELHFLDPRRQRKDVQKYELLQDLGWRVVRVVKEDLVDHRERLIARVRAARLR